MKTTAVEYRIRVRFSDGEPWQSYYRPFFTLPSARKFRRIVRTKCKATAKIVKFTTRVETKEIE